MSERPILFSTPMVRAILDGKKTQTRRVVKPQPDRKESLTCDWKCPYGGPGDHLWVRETFFLATGEPGPELWMYRATDDCEEWKGLGLWSPSIYMPRRASRLTLKIVRVRVERLWNLTVRDAICEGITHDASEEELERIMEDVGRWDVGNDRHKETFAALWDSINAKRGFSWDVNPWVWVIEFRRIV